MSTDDALRGLNAFHLRHGDIHQHHVWRGAVVFGNGGAAVAGLADNLAAKGFNHLGNVFAGKDGVIYHEVANRFAVFSYYQRELVHNFLLTSPSSKTF